MPDTEWLDGNIELYAADALTVDEENRVERELADLTPVERSMYDGRIAEVHSVMAEVAGSVARDAPPELRDRVLEQVFAAPGSVDTATGTADTAEGTGAAPADPRGTSGAGETASNVLPLSDPASRSRRIGLALVAAAAVAAIALGAGVLIGRSTAPEPTPPTAAQVQREQIADVLAAPDASLSVGRLDDNRGVISVVSSRDRNQAVAQLGDRRNPIPSDRQFQLWLVGKGPQPVSAGLVPPGAGGSPQLVDQIDASQVLAVTVEPIGGSAQPTSPILVQIPLAT